MFSLRLSFVVAAFLVAPGCGSGDVEPKPDASGAVFDAGGGGGDGGGGGGDAGMVFADAAPGANGYLEACDPSDDRCTEGLLCFTFNAKGPHCTHACDSPEDCEAPSSGCSGMGMCKLP